MTAECTDCLHERIKRPSFYNFVFKIIAHGINASRHEGLLSEITIRLRLVTAD